MSTVDGMSIASTTHSLVRQMNSVSVDPAVMQRAAKQHNDDSSTETIMSRTTGQLIPIPFAGNDDNDKDISGTTKQIKSWWGATALVSGLTIKFFAPFQGGGNQMVVDMS